MYESPWEMGRVFLPYYIGKIAAHSFDFPAIDARIPVVQEMRVAKVWRTYPLRMFYWAPVLFRSCRNLPNVKRLGHWHRNSRSS